MLFPTPGCRHRSRVDASLLNRNEEYFTRHSPNWPNSGATFLLLLVIRKRLSYIGQIATEFGRLVNEHRRISVAKVTTAVPLDDDRRALMQQWLAKATDRNVNLDERVDESILGGVVVQIGDRRFIASLVDQLEALRERMSLAQ